MRYIITLALIIQSFLIANTIHVPEDFVTIQSAINVSLDNDTVSVAAGFYEENINFIGKKVVVTSRYIIELDSLLIAATVIDGGENGSVVTFNDGETNESVLQGFTLQNGTGNNMDPDENGSFYTYGGGIYCAESDPIIRDCIIQNNTGHEGGGGGIFCYTASPKFYGCTIVDNETDDVGGGLYSRSGGNPEFYNCVFSGNVAEFGGGCYLRHMSDPYMENVTFVDNLANSSGGGVVLKDDANLESNGLKIIGNTAEGLGGGLYVNNADPELSFLMVASNTSSSGAGVYIRNTSVVNITNATITDNSAELYGNGIYMRDGVNVTLLNSIIWNNQESQVYFRTDGSDVELNISYSLLQDGESGIIDNDNGDINLGSGILDEDPYFCNGPGGNYFLRENSPCVDGGEGGALMGSNESGCGPVNIGPIWYVDHNGNDANDGSPETPFETIARAISAAMDGDTIRLNPGLYTETLNFLYKELVMESRVYETQNWDLVNETYFAPGPVGGSCMKLEGSTNNNVTIRGISFRGGSDPYGGGIVIQNCSPTLVDVVVEENTAEIGGGIYISESDPVFKRLKIRNNGANIGGGIYIVDSTPLFEETLFIENIAYWGAGIYSENAEPTITGCIFRKNQAFIEGGGLYQSGGIGTINWTSFEMNHGYDFGGGLVVNQATIDLDHTTFSDNISGMGSVMTVQTSAIQIVNSILWGNDGPLFYSPNGSGITSLDVSYSDIEGGVESINDNFNIIVTFGNGLLDIDPEFCDPVIQDYALEDGSVCLVGSENGEVIGAFDIECGNVLGTDGIIVPSGFYLAQNYPNPFNSTTKIDYTLITQGFYTLNIFNINGSLVRILKSEMGTPGTYSIRWDGRNFNGHIVPTGMYFYQLISAEGILNRKMLLLK